MTGTCEYYHNTNIMLLLIMLTMTKDHLLLVSSFFSNVFIDIAFLFGFFQGRKLFQLLIIFPSFDLSLY